MALRKTEFDNILMKHPARALKIRRAYMERRAQDQRGGLIPRDKGKARKK